MEVKHTTIIGIGLWFVALVYSMLIMTLLGLDTTDPNFSFDIDHPKYWTFELIMIPSFLIVGMLTFRWYFRKSEISDWKKESIKFGVVIMLYQFLLDTLVLVFLFGNGFTYFYGFVTIMYLSIPFWAFLAARLWK